MLAFRSCGAKYNGSRRLSSVVSWASREEELATLCDAAAVQLPGPGRGHAILVRSIIFDIWFCKHALSSTALVQNHQLWSQSKSMVVTAASVSCLGYCPSYHLVWCPAHLLLRSRSYNPIDQCPPLDRTYEWERRKLPADRSGNILSLAPEKIRRPPRLCQQNAVISNNFT